MEVKSYAKINLGLDIINRRSDGYHNISSIMCNVDLYDVLFFEKEKEGISLNCNKGGLSLGEDNLIYKAWKLMCDLSERDLGINIFLDKRLPIGAGIAGGTSNGAATLKALNKIYNLNYSQNFLMEKALKLGADFPYCISARPSLCQGIGEVISPISLPKSMDLLIVNPGYEVSTKEVYENIKLDNSRIDFENIKKILESGKFEELRGRLINKMETYVVEKHKELGLLKEKMLKMGAVEVAMSGSGPTFFGIFTNRVALESAWSNLRREFPLCYRTKAPEVII